MYLGIDVAKSKLDAVLLLPDTKPAHTTVSNSPGGLQKLAAWLDERRKGATIHACLEATGTYGEAAARFFANQGHTVSVVNPAAIHAFGRCQLTRSKTDRIDATLNRPFLPDALPSSLDATHGRSRRITSSGAPVGIAGSDVPHGKQPP